MSEHNPACAVLDRLWIASSGWDGNNAALSDITPTGTPPFALLESEGIASSPAERRIIPADCYRLVRGWSSGWWGSWEYVKTHCDHSERHGIRAHAATIMENAALKAENERLRGKDEDGFHEEKED